MPLSSLHVRDVIVIHKPGHEVDLVIHRIISLTPGPTGPIIQTQGDANLIPDSWKVTLRGPTAYRAVFTLPLIGYVAVWAHNPSGHLFLMLLGLCLITYAVIRGVIQIRKTRAEPVPVRSATPNEVC